MKGRDRNKLCTCNSGLKAKDCTQKELDTCSHFLIQDHDRREKAVYSFFSEMINEINTSVKEGDKKAAYNSVKIKISICFIIAEVMAYSWDNYRNKTQGSAKSVKNWIQQFCLTDENKSYKQDATLSPLTANALYQLRCSLFHVFALPETTDDIDIMLAPDSVDSEIKNKITQTLKKSLFIHPIQLFHLFCSGFELTLNQFVQNINIKEKNLAHLQGIKRIYDEQQRRGSVSIKMD